MRSIKLGVIGAGRMGHAIVASLISRNMFTARQIFVAEPEAKARRRAARLGCLVSNDPLPVAAGAPTILLAVKPQKISDVAEHIRPAVRGKHVISILAGTTRRRLSALLPGARIVRVMPNTPLMAGEGATAIARDGARRADLQFTSRMFSAVGKVWLVPESWMNAVTAVSGSGPALFCAFLEACAESGTASGLPRPIADELARQTMIGTARLLKDNPHLSPANLREGVTSPGGTTETALKVFHARRLDALVKEAIRAAVSRGRELGA